MLVSTLLVLALQSCPIPLDFAKQPVDLASDPAEVTSFAGGYIYSGWTYATGRELIQSDGTSAGTRVPMDVTPGTIGSDPTQLFVEGPYLYFLAADSAVGRELWRTDGTTAGTLRLADIAPGPADSQVEWMVGEGGRVFFSADDQVHGRELWVTDGTPSGTQMVLDFWPGPTSSYATAIAGGAGRVLCYAQQPGTSSLGLFVTDGSAAGTQLVLDLATQKPGTQVGQATWHAASGQFLFETELQNSDAELWACGGSAATTHSIANLGVALNSKLQGVTSAFVDSGLPALGGDLLFTKTGPTSNSALFRTDGTAAGTGLFADFYPAKAEGVLFDTHVLWKGELYFGATNFPAGTELWKTDGTVAGSVLVADLVPGLSSSRPQPMITWGGLLFVYAESKFDQLDMLVVTGGTSATTSVLHVFDPGVIASRPVATNAGILFTVKEGQSAKPWISDGTQAGTRPLLDLQIDLSPTGGLNDPFVPTAAGALFLSQNQGEPVQHLYATDGALTVPVDVPEPKQATLGIQPDWMRLSGGDELYLATHLDGTKQLARYDPNAGLTLVAEVAQAGNANGPGDFTDFWNGSELRVAMSGPSSMDAGKVLWVTDGTRPGTLSLGANLVSNKLRFEALGEGFVFTSYDSTSGIELWASDGTSAGTALIADINPTPSKSSTPLDLVRLGDRVLFSADDGVSGRELWSSDGVGAQLVMELNPNGGSNPRLMTRIGGRVIFFANATGVENGYDLWVTDGSAGGTQLVATFGLTEAELPYEGIVVMGGVVYFPATNPVFGRELWRSDLTAAGTHIVADLAPGSASTTFNTLAATDDQVFFVGFVAQPAFLDGVFATDGTSAGTHLAADLTQYQDFSTIESLTPVGHGVYFYGPEVSAGVGQLYFTDGMQLVTHCDLALGSPVNSLFQNSPLQQQSSYLEGLTMLNGDLLMGGYDPNGVGRELFVLPSAGATTQNLGLGSSALMIESNTPFLGAPLEVRGFGTPAGDVAALLISPAPANPLALPAIGPFAFWIDPLQSTNLGLFGSQNWQTQFVVPNNPALAGKAFNLQAFVVDQATGSIRGGSNGVQLVPGN